MFTCGMK